MQKSFYWLTKPPIRVQRFPNRMFSTIFGVGGNDKSTGTSESLNFSLDTVVSDIATAHAPLGPVALTAASQFLEQKLIGCTSRNNRLRTEFAALEALQAKKYNLEYDYTVASAATDVDLNRYVDVLPYEHTRVKVQINPPSTENNTSSPTRGGHGTPSGSFRSFLKRKNSNSRHQVVREQLSNYINASFITCTDPYSGNGTSNTTPTSTTWRYIAAQGPLPTTCSTFWHMIVQEKVKSIVMLTDIIENKRKKCHEYFPLDVGVPLHVALGMEVITICVRELMPGLVLRKLQVNLIGGDDTSCVVDHYHYTGWPDHGVPQSAAPLFLLSYLLRNGMGGSGDGNTDGLVLSSGSSGANSEESPIVVHCSAGIGRSGVFCVVDSAARRLIGAAKVGGGGSDAFAASTSAAAAAAQKAVNVGEIVAELRKQRAGMVQTAEQFVFCHTALLELTKAAIEKVSFNALAAAGAAPSYQRPLY
jgi:protein tyrosine phosphatase